MRLKGPRIAFVLLSFFLWQPARTLTAGESFLSRDAKVHEAVPYGRTIDATPAQAREAQPDEREEDDSRHVGPSDATLSKPVDSEKGREPGPGEGSAPGSAGTQAGE